MSLMQLAGHHNWSPDILDCLSNLSADEVFTPPATATQMLDLLPKEVWSDATLRWLDPSAKTGVFLREIAIRLMTGLKEVFPDEEQRRQHIFKNMLFGIAITDLTAQITRRSLYYSKDASSKYAVVKFDTPEGNIWYERTTHTFKHSICTECGAPESTERGGTLENYAYGFIHKKDVFDNMKFDIIVGNPPYQLESNGHGAQATPLYHKFIQKALALKPKYMSFIIPSRWFAGGMGLNQFREDMLNDRHIKSLVDFGDASECFPGVEIKGGVCYFLWEAAYNGDCSVQTIARGVASPVVKRPLNEFEIFVRSNEAISILSKVRAQAERTVEHQMSSLNPFSLPTNLTGIKEIPGVNHVKVYARGTTGWIPCTQTLTQSPFFNKHKVLMSKAYGAGSTVPHQITGKPLRAEPKSVCTMTYFVVGAYDSAKEADSFACYMRTKFFRFLVSLRKNTQDTTKGKFAFVPDLPMTQFWTDKDLYARYNLTVDEIAYIESVIKEMP